MTNELPFQELVSILRRRIWLILAVAILGTLLVGAGALMIQPKYTAKAEIVVEPQPAGILGGGQAAVALPPDEPAVLTEVTELTSHDNLQRVLDSLGKDPAFLAAMTKPISKSGTIGDVVRQWLAGWMPLPQWSPGEDARQLSLRALERQLKVAQESGSHVIGVSFTWANPTGAAMVANRVTKLYLESQIEQKRKSADNALTWLDKRIPELKDKVERQEAAEQAYQSAHSMPAADHASVVDQEVADLNRQLVVAQIDLATRHARLNLVRGLRERGSGADTLAENLGSPALTELQHEALALRQSQAALAGNRIGSLNPKSQQVREQLGQLQREIAREVDRATSNLENEERIAAAQVHSIQTRLATVQAPTTDLHLRELERGAESSRRIYESMLQRREELHEQREMLSPGVLVVSLASPPDRPSSHDPILFVFPAAIVFLICGSLLAVLVDRLDQTLKSERDVHDALGVLCIGMVPRLRRLGKARPHELLLDKPFAPYAEAVRSIVATLQLAAPDDCAPKVILISSSVPGEGKTTLAVSCAAYAARLKRKVLLVDFDFRHPATVRELGRKAKKRRVDLIPGEPPSTTSIVRIPSLQMDYLPVRCGSTDPLTLFASAYMQEFLRRVRETYDCVVIDSAPLLAITESRLLALLVDKVVFVVKWGSTRRVVARNAIELLRNTGVLDKNRGDCASVVITQVDLKRHARYRYGDSGEFFMRYVDYLQAPVRADASGSGQHEG